MSSRRINWSVIFFSTLISAVACHEILHNFNLAQLKLALTIFLKFVSVVVYSDTSWSDKVSVFRKRQKETEACCVISFVRSDFGGSYERERERDRARARRDRERERKRESERERAQETEGGGERKILNMR